MFEISRVDCTLQNYNRCPVLLRGRCCWAPWKTFYRCLFVSAKNTILPERRLSDGWLQLLRRLSGESIYLRTIAFNIFQVNRPIKYLSADRRNSSGL